MTSKTVAIEAEFDGRVIIPLQPLNIPPHTQIDVTVAVSQRPQRSKAALTAGERKEILDRIVRRAGEGANLPSEALRRENMYED